MIYTIIAKITNIQQNGNDVMVRVAIASNLMAQIRLVLIP